MRLEEAESGLRAGLAHGEGAHLLGVKDRVDAVLPVHSDTARARHCGTQAACRVVSNGHPDSGQLQPPAASRNLGDLLHRHIYACCEAW